VTLLHTILQEPCTKCSVAHLQQLQLAQSRLVTFKRWFEQQHFYLSPERKIRQRRSLTLSGCYIEKEAYKRWLYAM